MYTIGRLAHRAHVNADSIRFWERQGLLEPSTKTASGYRLYDNTAIERIAFVKHAQRCGFNLSEVREMLEMHKGEADACERGYALAERKLAEIREAYKALRAMDEALTRVLESRGQPMPGGAARESPLIAALGAVMSSNEAAPAHET